MTPIAWVNGQKDSSALASDMGLMLGWTAFETLRTYGGVPFRLDAHLSRLSRSCALLRLPCPPLDEVAAAIREASTPEVVLRFTVTAGGNQVLTARPVDEGAVGAPVRCAWLRWDTQDIVPGAAKHGARAFWSLAAAQAEVEEVLLHTAEGRILEASRSNLVAVVGGTLLTPPADGSCLEGVTRGALLDAAAEAGLRMEEAELRVGQRFDELYLCSTLKELAPVVGELGAPQPAHGPVGRSLHRAFRALVRRETGVEPAGRLVGG